ncbi:MAG: hypothetical protein ABIK86_00820 [candidate division WOR-3 bacterium]
MKRLACLVTFVLIGCNMSPVGFGGLQNRVPAVRLDSLRADSMAGFSRLVPLSSGQQMYVGQDSLYRSRALCRFALPDTLTLTAIQAVRLVLHPVDSTAGMKFVCRPCSTEWDSSAATWYMADGGSHWYTPGGDFWPVDVATGNLQGESVVVDLRYRDLEEPVREAVRLNGIFLLPDIDTGIVAVWSAGATAAKRPRIRVSYSGGAEKSFDATVTTTLVDTMPRTVSPFDLLVGAGVAFRTWLRFRLDSIPREATIARADLFLRVEPKYMHQESVALSIRRLTESFGAKGVYAQFEALPSASRYYRPGDTLVRFDIRSLVQYWTSQRDRLGQGTGNFGLLVMAEPEWTRPFRVRVTRSGVRAPRLDVEFVMPPEGRF